MTESAGGPRRFLRALPAALFIGLPAVLILSALRPGTFLFGYDILNTFYSLRGVVGQALAGGRIPVWDPHVTCGAPLLAQMQSAVFYPLTWPVALLGPGAFWTFTVAVHLALAGFFAFAWLERGLAVGRAGALAGAGLFLLSGFAAVHLYGGHLTLLSAYPWAPAILWRLERFLAAPTVKRAALLSAVLAMMILAGFPQLVFITGFAAAARLIHHVFEDREGRRGRGRISAGAAAALLAGILPAAPQLLPTLELFGQAQRTSVHSVAFATTYSMPPENLITFLAPTFFGDSRSVPYWGRWYLWEVSGFVGVASLALAALGLAGAHRQRRLWAGAAVAALLLALGRHTPVFEGVYALVPGMDLFRGPARFLMLFTLSMAPLAAMGVDRLWEGAARTQAARMGAGVGVVFLIVASSCGILASADAGGFWKDLLADEAEAARGIREEAGLSGAEFTTASKRMAVASLGWSAATLAAIGVVLLLHHRGRLDGRRSAAALGLLMAVELVAFDSRYFVAHPENDRRWPPEFVAAVRSHPRFPFRLATVFVGQTDEIGKCQLAGLDHVGGYDPLMLKRYTELINVSQGAPASAPVTAMIPGRTGPVMDLLGVREWVIPGMHRTIPGWKELGPLGDATVYENPAALPRAFLVSRSRVIASDAERLKYLTGSAFKPSQEVVLESGRDESFEPGGGTTRILSMEPGSYRVEVESRGDAWLVLSEAWFPGWRAMIDGAPAEIQPADHLVQAVRVPAGKHEVRFEYRSTWLRTGLIVSLLAVVLPFAAAWLRRRRAHV